MDCNLWIIPYAISSVVGVLVTLLVTRRDRR